MHCKQKLCSRSKNLSKNGNCSVCEDVLENSKVAHANINKQKTVPRIEVDLKKMVEIHDQLSKGANIDPKVVSGLLLSGIINILKQHDALEHLEEKIKVLEHDNLTNRNRTEALENWVTKQDKAISDLSQKLSENETVVKEHSHDKEDSKTFEKSCNVCSEIFLRNSDFENRMTETHGVEKPFQCDVCSKTFLLEWRLKKHELIHIKRTKTCNFFLSKTPCPFNDIGCKFAHENEANKDPIENAEDVEDEYSLDMNECHLCHLKLSSRDDLWEHVENQHVEYFQGMIEYAADNRSQSC